MQTGRQVRWRGFVGEGSSRKSRELRCQPVRCRKMAGAEEEVNSAEAGGFTARVVKEEQV